MVNTRVSVAMATYNGEKYIKEQLKSILCQLKDNDEVIVSDDSSNDKTLEIINDFNDKRIKIINGPKKGVKQNFANAIKNCSGDYIFLSDQDDIWIDGKVDKVLKMFSNQKCQCITHDATVINGDDTNVLIESFFKHRNSKKGIIGNIIKNKYLGCCMAFTKEMKQFILPIPNDIEMHDQWIGIICEKHGKSYFYDEKLIKYRRHNDNVSSMQHYPVFKMVKNRMKFIKRIVGR